MAKNKRQKVKHYNRSFYSRETRVKRGIGIVVLVAHRQVKPAFFIDNALIV